MKDKLALKQGYKEFNPGPQAPQKLNAAEPEGPKATEQATKPLIRPVSRAVRKEREAANASAAKMMPVQKMPSNAYDEDYDNDDFSNANDFNFNNDVKRENEIKQVPNQNNQYIQ